MYSREMKVYVLKKTYNKINMKKKTYKNVHSNFIHDSYKMAIARVFVNRRMNKQIMVYII